MILLSELTPDGLKCEDDSVNWLIVLMSNSPVVPTGCGKLTPLPVVLVKSTLFVP